MNDERLDEALRALPRPGASPDFTARVLGRVARGRFTGERGSRGRIIGVAALAAAVLLAAPLGMRRLGERTDDAAARRAAQLRALRDEGARLAAELEDLRRLGEEEVPVIYVGSDHGVDLVLSVARLTQAMTRFPTTFPEK
jgi:hypothetical protein